VDHRPGSIRHSIPEFFKHEDSFKKAMYKLVKQKKGNNFELGKSPADKIIENIISDLKKDKPNRGPMLVNEYSHFLSNNYTFEGPRIEKRKNYLIAKTPADTAAPVETPQE
jgi:hypothetical protein